MLIAQAAFTTLDQCVIAINRKLTWKSYFFLLRKSFPEAASADMHAANVGLSSSLQSWWPGMSVGAYPHPCGVRFSSSHWSPFPSSSMVTSSRKAFVVSFSKPCGRMRRTGRTGIWRFFSRIQLKRPGHELPPELKQRVTKLPTPGSATTSCAHFQHQLHHRSACRRQHRHLCSLDHLQANKSARSHSLDWSLGARLLTPEIPAMTVTFALIQKGEIHLRHLGGDVKKPEQGGLRICPSLLLTRKSSKSVLTNMRRRQESRWVDEQTPSRLLFNVDSVSGRMLCVSLARHLQVPQRVQLFPRWYHY